MKLERSMGNGGVINVAFKAVGGHDMVDFVVRHGACANVVETAENRQNDDDDEQEFLDS